MVLPAGRIAGRAEVVAQQTSQKVVNKDHVIAGRMAGERGCGREILETGIDQTLVWAWGANSCGQLGTGSVKEKLVPSDQPLDLSLGQHSDTIKDAGGGGGFSFLVTESGNVFTSGNNGKGQLGQGSLMGNVTNFCHCQTLLGVVVQKVAAGWDFMLALSDTGSVFSWGSNSFGQLGRTLTNGGNCDARPAEVAGLAAERQIDIAGGLRHGLALSECGHVYAWGHGKRGQLGSKGIVQGSEVKTEILTKVEVTGGEKPVQLLAGMYHSGILTEAGSVLVWGCNRYGQCGMDPTNSQSVLVPRKIDVPSQSDSSVAHGIVAVESGWTHIMARTGSGVLYSWGRADLGQLGRLCEGVYDFRPEPVTGLPPVIQHVCGSEHTLAVCGSGQAYSWGWNEHSICGTEDELNVLKPHPISQLFNRTVLRVGCGAGHSFCIGVSGGRVS